MFTCMRFSTAMLFVAVALTAPSVVVAGEGGLALGPALILVRDVPPGRPFTLHEAAKVRFHLVNNSAEAGEFEVVCSLPIDAGMRSHEIGYEAPPQAAWFSLDKRVVTLEAGARVEIDLKVDIPDLPEHFNRHWMVYVDAGRVQRAGIGATLRLRARVMVETRVQAGIGEALARTGMIGIDPGTVVMHPAGAVWSGEARMRNNSSQAAIYDVLRLDQAIPADQADKRARYFDHASLAERTPWGQAVEGSVTLAPGEERVIRFTTAPGVAVLPTAPMEEVMFVARRAADGADLQRCRELAGRFYDHAGLVRLRYAGQPSGAATAP